MRIIPLAALLAIAGCESPHGDIWCDGKVSKGDEVRHKPTGLVGVYRWTDEGGVFIYFPGNATARSIPARCEDVEVLR